LIGRERHARCSRVSRACLLLFALACGALEATKARDPVELARPPVRLFTEKDGLPPPEIHASAVDRDGFLWVAAIGGVARYDGRRWARVTLPKQAAPAKCLVILPASDGALWFGTNGGGLHRLDGETWTSWDERSELGSSVVYSLVETRTENGAPALWIGTRDGLVRFSGGRFTAYDERSGVPRAPVMALLERTSGAARGLWVGMRDGLVRLRDGRATTFDGRSGLPGGFIECLLETGGVLWVGTTAGLARFEGERFTAHGAGTGLPGADVRCLEETLSASGKRALWIGTDGGLVRYQDGAFVRMDRLLRLPSETVTVIQPMPRGAPTSLIWLGMETGGLARVRLGGWVALDSTSGLPADSVTSFEEIPAPDEAGVYYLGTTRGLARFENGAFRTITTKDGLPHDRVTRLKRGLDETLWVGTDGPGLASLRGQNLVPIALPPGASGAVTCILETESSGAPELWVGVEGRALARRAGSTWTVMSPEHGWTGSTATELFESRLPDGTRRLWAGTFPRGLATFDGRRWTAHTAGGLPASFVVEGREVLGAAGRRELWVGTSVGGAARLESDGRRWTVLSDSTEPALPSNAVASLQQDEKGRLYVLTAAGVARLTRREPSADDPVPYALETLTVEDGLPSNSIWQSASLRDSRGRIWVGTDAGAAILDPSQEVPDIVRKPLHLKQTVLRGKTARALVPDEELPHDQNSLAFESTLLSYEKESGTRYRTELVGLGDSASDWTADFRKEYPSLPAGRYTFRVWGKDGAGNVTGPVAVSFRILPPPWRTVWAFLLYLGLAAGLAYAGTRARTETLRRRNVELQRAVLSAQDRIAQLLASAPAASESIAAWSKSLAEDVATAVGVERIGVWEVDGERLAPLSPADLAPPSVRELHGLISAMGPAFVPSGSGLLFPVTGMSGELCGALVVSGGASELGESERRLVAGFAHQLGGALEMRRVRRRLDAAEERRAATRREMRERGIATLQTCPACGRCYDDTAASCEADGSPLESPRPLPYVLLDRYRFLRVLGRGGMGLVLAASDERLGREVAIKLLRPDHFDDPELRRRFAREARTLARIQHPGVIALYDSGELPDATMFLVMERLAGRDLANVLKVHGPGTARQVASLVRQGSAALDAAHRAGIVHRDLKPENVFLSGDPGGFRVRLLDFGVAKPLGGEGRVTRTGMVIGTPAYMPPEQVHGEDVDTRADVYSFAAVCYEALTGRTAIQGTDLGRVLVNVVHAEPPRLSTLLVGVPHVVDEAFASALAKDRARRLADIEAWASSFVDALETMPEDPRVPGWPAGESAFWDADGEAPRAGEDPSVSPPRPVSRLDPVRWQAVSPYLDRALTLNDADCAALIAALRERQPAVAADLEALLDAERALDRDGFLERPPLSGSEDRLR
jgi:serine/threonine protein kinase/ligand-binding sensor domain-containing protein